MNLILKLGRYKHFKGNYYDVIGVASHSETHEKFVVYCALYGKKSLWVRPYDMFTENIKLDDKIIPRYVFVGDDKKK